MEIRFRFALKSFATISTLSPLEPSFISMPSMWPLKIGKLKAAASGGMPLKYCRAKLIQSLPEVPVVFVLIGKSQFC